MLKRRLYFALSVLVVVSMMLAACGGGGAAPAEPAASAPEAAPAEATTAPAEAAAAEEPTATPVGQEENVAQTVQASELKPPVVATPCAPGSCPFEGQTVTVIVNTAGEKGPISGPFYEVRDEFEAATGAKLEIVESPFAGPRLEKLLAAPATVRRSTTVLKMAAKLGDD